VQIEDLIRESWKIYSRFERLPFLVKPSIPILFFGDSDQYSTSRLKVITLGLNPSKLEFQNGEPFHRFSKVREVHTRMVDGENYDEYVHALRGYFDKGANHPYEKWFSSFEHVLTGLDCSYYGTAANTALHTDLCSPLATDPTWSHLQPEVREELRQSGARLWHSLVDWLSPDLIIASVAWRHMEENFPALDWRIIREISGKRKRPYSVKLTEWKLGNGKIARLVFGQATQTPFGTVSNEDRVKIGGAIRDAMQTENYPSASG
jgi:hypothetical protein